MKINISCFIPTILELYWTFGSFLLKTYYIINSNFVLLFVFFDEILCLWLLMQRMMLHKLLCYSRWQQKRTSLLEFKFFSAIFSTSWVIFKRRFDLNVRSCALFNNMFCCNQFIFPWNFQIQFIKFFSNSFTFLLQAFDKPIEISVFSVMHSFNLLFAALVDSTLTFRISLFKNQQKKTPNKNRR